MVGKDGHINCCLMLVNLEMKIEVCISKLSHSFAILWQFFEWWSYIHTTDQIVSIEHKCCVKLLNSLCPKTSMSWNGLALGHYVGYIAKLVLPNVGQFFELKKTSNSNYLNIAKFKNHQFWFFKYYKIKELLIMIFWN